MAHFFIEHDSHDVFYRYPFGSVSCNEKITLRLKLSETHDIKVLLCVYRSKGMDEEIFMADKGDGLFETELESSSTPQLIWYHFKVIKGGNVFFYGNNEELLGGIGSIFHSDPQSYQITVFSNNNSTPNWFKDAIVYQIFVDRFFNGNSNKEVTSPKEGSLIHSHWENTPVYVRDAESGRVIRWDFFGGNLQGVLKKLPYLKELGVNVLYLNPIFEAPSNHKYDTGDYKKVDPMFGDNEYFEYLCLKAAEMGIYIILDGVFSHTGSDSLYFNKENNYMGLGAYQSQDSPYYNWYRFIDYPDVYESWWGIDTLPNVNELEPTYQDFIVNDDDSVSKIWLKKGAVGWRLDVVDELPGDFVKKLKKAVKEVNSEAVLIGEVWEDASNKVSYDEKREYLLGDELDSATNYPLRNILLDFMLGFKDAGKLHKHLMSIYENYPLEHFYSTLNLIGSHDVQRAMTIVSESPAESELTFDEASKVELTPESERLGIERMKILSLLQMTFPGVPCIYYGDEAGLTGYSDPLCRKPFPWGRENEELLEWYKKVIRLRNENDALRTGSWETVISEDDVYCFARIITGRRDVFRQEKTDGAFFVIVNKSKERDISMTINMESWLPKGGELVNLLGNEGEYYKLENGYLSMTITALDGKVLMLKK